MLRRTYQHTIRSRPHKCHVPHNAMNAPPAIATTTFVPQPQRNTCSSLPCHRTFSRSHPQHTTPSEKRSASAAREDNALSYRNSAVDGASGVDGRGEHLFARLGEGAAAEEGGGPADDLVGVVSLRGTWEVDAVGEAMRIRTGNERPFKGDRRVEIGRG